PIAHFDLSPCSLTVCGHHSAQYWPAYNAADQSPAQVPWKGTQIAYYFVTVTSATGFTVPTDQPASDIKAFVSQAKANGVKPVFSLGGWSGSIHFSSLVDSGTKRASLASKVQAFMTKWGFEGVDLDWEYPNGVGIGCNAVNKDDSAHLLSFLKVLRQKLGTSKLITAAVSTEGFAGPDGSPLASFAEYGKYLDYVNLMTYDIAGSWSPTTGPNAPLRKCKSDSSVQTAVKLWTGRGFPAAKVLLGIPAYAISFTTSSSTLKEIEVSGGKWRSKAYQAWDGVVPKGAPGDSNAPYTDECGTKTAAKDGSKGLNGYTRYYDDCAQTPFLFNPSKKHYISYDDAQSARVKTSYAMREGLGGVCVSLFACFFLSLDGGV
ncbi:chitinase, partial [Rhodotorula diobovata]